MKKSFFFYIIIVSLFVIACSEQEKKITKSESEETNYSVDEKTNSAELTTVDSNDEKQTVADFSANIGKLYGNEISSLIDGLDIDMFARGFTDANQQKEPAYTSEEIAVQLQRLEKHVQANASDPNLEPYSLKDEAEHLSYSLGHIQGVQLSSFEKNLQMDTFMTNFRQSYLEGDDNIAEIEGKVQMYVKSKRGEQTAIREEQEQKNLKKGESFLRENKEKEGIIITESGLQYKVLQLGEGSKPQASDKVEVHYEGKLLDNSIFDSSYERNQTATFPLSGVIAGWTEGLQYMPVGSKFRFFIPPDLGYGVRGSGSSIGPNETLIFDVELIAIK